MVFVNPHQNGSEKRIEILKETNSEYNKVIKQLQLQTEHYRNLYMEMPTCYLSMDVDGNLIAVNNAWLNLTGYSESEIIGHWFGEFMPPKEQMPFRKIFPDYLELGEMQVDIPIIRANRSEVVVHIDGRIEKDRRGRIKQTHCFVNDISKHKEKAAQWSESQKELSFELNVMKKIQHIGSHYMKKKNLEKTMDEVLDAAMFITGSDMGTVQLFDPVSETLKIIAYRGFEKPWLDFWDSVQEGQGSCGMALKAKDRIIIEDITESALFRNIPALNVQMTAGVWAVQSTPLINRSKKNLGMISTHFKKPHRPNSKTLNQIDLLARQAADIIEYAQSEEENKRQRLLLSHSQKMDAIVTLAGGIAHDFNNILSSILGYTELTLELASKDKTIERNLYEIYAAGNQAKDLVKQLLTFARKSDEKRSLIREFSKFCVMGWASKVASLFSGSGSQALRMGTTNAARRKGLASAGAGFASTFLFSGIKYISDF